MALFRRIIWYLFGVALGMILVVFILKQKNGGKGVEYCYLPNCRVLKQLRSKPITLDSSMTHIDTTGISLALMDGKVRFKKSEARKKPCGEYLIEWEKKQLLLANCSTEVKVLRWKGLP